MDKLNFLTAGMPLKTEPKSYENAFKILKSYGLDGIELEFVRGVRMSEASQNTVREATANKDFVITAHGPFYVNLNSKEVEKIDASVERILETARMAHSVGAYSITYHAAFYMGHTPDVVFEQVKKQTQRIIDVVEKEGLDIWIRPETTGKGTQWGDLDEIINLSKEFKQVLPCVDFSHLHARCGGGLNSYDDFSMMLEKIGNELGQNALDNCHMHLAGIEYSQKGEKKHLIFEESDMNYKDLLKALKAFNVKGALVCESPNIEDDCKLLKDYYLSI
ncbi:TIM barrel protein [bacterium]|nr:TIM barrel protein [bacterium]